MKDTLVSLEIGFVRIQISTEQMQLLMCLGVFRHAARVLDFYLVSHK